MPELPKAFFALEHHRAWQFGIFDADATRVDPDLVPTIRQINLFGK